MQEIQFWRLLLCHNSAMTLAYSLNIFLSSPTSCPRVANVRWAFSSRFIVSRSRQSSSYKPLLWSSCNQQSHFRYVWRYIKLKTHNILNVAQIRNAQGNKTCNVARNLNVLPVAKLIRCRKWKRFNAKNLIVSTNNCSALKNCTFQKCATFRKGRTLRFCVTLQLLRTLRLWVNHKRDNIKIL